MKNKIQVWETKIANLFREREEALNYQNSLRRGEVKFKTLKESGAAAWEAAGRVQNAEKVTGFEAHEIRKEILEFVKKEGKNISNENLIWICKIFNWSSCLYPEYEVILKDNKGNFLEKVVSEDYKEHRKICEAFEPIMEKAWKLEEEIKEAKKVEAMEVVERAEEPKEEEKIEKVKKESKKRKRLSKSQKLKIEREKRKIKREKRRIKELAELQREQKRDIAKRNRLLKELLKLDKAIEKRGKKIALLTKKSEGSDESNGSSQTGGNEGNEEGKGGETTETRGMEEAKKVEAMEVVEKVEEPKEEKKGFTRMEKNELPEWRKIKSSIHKGIYRVEVTLKIGHEILILGEIQKVNEENLLKKASEVKKYLGEIEKIEVEIEESGKFKNWCPGWFKKSPSFKNVMKFKKICMEWIESNKEKLIKIASEKGLKPAWLAEEMKEEEKRKEKEKIEMEERRRRLKKHFEEKRKQREEAKKMDLLTKKSEGSDESNGSSQTGGNEGNGQGSEGGKSGTNEVKKEDSKEEKMKEIKRWFVIKLKEFSPEILKKAEEVEEMTKRKIDKKFELIGYLMNQSKKERKIWNSEDLGEHFIWAKKKIEQLEKKVKRLSQIKKVEEKKKDSKDEEIFKKAYWAKKQMNLIMNKSIPQQWENWRNEAKKTFRKICLDIIEAIDQLLKSKDYSIKSLNLSCELMEEIKKFQEWRKEKELRD